MNIRQLNNSECDKAIALALDVFTECGSADFDANGLQTFKSFIHNPNLINELPTFPEAIGYMTNCVHPIIVHETLSHPFNRTDTVRSRFIGIQANTSSLSYSELDGVHDLKESSPFDFTDETIKLLTEYHLKIVGGCCGTDNRHME